MPGRLTRLFSYTHSKGAGYICIIGEETVARSAGDLGWARTQVRSKLSFNSRTEWLQSLCA